MSEVNKLDSTQCQINPDQYKIKIDTVTAPVGSCPWAIIQVYLGNKLHRSDWDTPNEYMRLTSKKPGNNSVYIEKSDKHGTWFSWQPTPEDLMACDWILLSEVKPIECTLSFDLNIGTGTSGGSVSGGAVGWGYEAAGGGWPPFGTLDMNPNKVDIVGIWEFMWNETAGGLYIGSSSKQSSESYQKVGNLFKNKSLYVMLDGITYNLGESSSSSLFPQFGPYSDQFSYQNAEGEKLGSAMKHLVGKTKNFCLNWK
ncbi:Thoeris anti-defense Tad2 family protein [Xenorhabdus stockiae]|uniref:Thoeris anti-defense Tad2 family protein n=1 Tax=Xenorhabdus stockiae TaxID=351614 RepID=UPI003CEE38FF